MTPSRSAPPLPQSLVPEGRAESTDDPQPLATTSVAARYNQPISIGPVYRQPTYRFQSLRHGCYFLQWRPKDTWWYRFNGTMRVERHGAGTTASGDLYHHNAYIIQRWPSYRFVSNPDPSPSAGIPIFPRSGYRYYLRVTGILEWFTIGSGFTLRFERHRFDSSSNSWTNEGEFSAYMAFKPAPSGYPSGATYLEGDLKDPVGTDVGRISMGWVSPFLRKAVLEVDRVSQSEYPTDNGGGVDWENVYEAVDWDVSVYESDTDLSEPSGEFWSDAEMHAAMLDRRDSSDLDNEWRYHLICVRRLDSTSRGIMYDAYGGDSNNIPREGASIASHWTIPDTSQWGTVAGERFGAAAAPYFRTAVHEIGHAMGLYHNTADTGFMNTTGTIAASAGTFPGNVQWAFNGADQRRLRHMPDPWVRPGMIPFGQSYGSTPVSPEDRLDLGEDLQLSVEPLLDSVPIGAPVRVRLTLTNHAEVPLRVPDSLSLKTEHVRGEVVDPSGTVRGFQSILRCIEEEEMSTLEAGESMTHDLTLLRGAQGALFPAPGAHTVRVSVTWELDGMPVRVAGKGSVMVEPARDQSHASAALKVLSAPDLLLTLALGGDHLDEGVEALKAAMDDDTLAPHYGVIEAKRVGRRFKDREADPAKALEIIDDKTVMSPSEVRRMTTIAKELPAKERKKKNRASGLRAMKKRAAGADALKGEVDGLL